MKKKNFTKEIPGISYHGSFQLVVKGVIPPGGVFSAIPSFIGSVRLRSRWELLSVINQRPYRWASGAVWAPIQDLDEEST